MQTSKTPDPNEQCWRGSKGWERRFHILVGFFQGLSAILHPAELAENLVGMWIFNLKNTHFYFCQVRICRCLLAGVWLACRSNLGTTLSLLVGLVPNEYFWVSSLLHESHLWEGIEINFECLTEELQGSFSCWRFFHTEKKKLVRRFAHFPFRTLIHAPIGWDVFQPWRQWGSEGLVIMEPGYFQIMWVRLTSGIDLLPRCWI